MGFKHLRHGHLLLNRLLGTSILTITHIVHNHSTKHEKPKLNDEMNNRCWFCSSQICITQICIKYKGNVSVYFIDLFHIPTKQKRKRSRTNKNALNIEIFAFGSAEWRHTNGKVIMKLTSCLHATPDGFLIRNLVIQITLQLTKKI